MDGVWEKFWALGVYEVFDLRIRENPEFLDVRGCKVDGEGDGVNLGFGGL